MATRRYDYIPKAPNAKRYLVAQLTPRAAMMGLMHGDVVEVGERGILILRATAAGPPQKMIDSLVVSGTLAPLISGEAA